MKTYSINLSLASAGLLAATVFFLSSGVAAADTSTSTVATSTDGTSTTTGMVITNLSSTSASTSATSTTDTGTASTTIMTGTTTASTTTTGVSSTATLMPIAQAGTLSTTVNMSATGTVMATDPNTPALPLTYSVVQYPSNGILQSFDSATGAFMYAPVGNFTGTDSFTFMASNGTSSATSSLTITVMPASTTQPTTTPVTTPLPPPMMGTTTASSTDEQIADLQDNILTLYEYIQFLQGEIQVLAGALQNLGGSTPSMPGTGTSTPEMMAQVSPQNTSLSAGGSVDFSGTNWGHEETVNIMRGSTMVGTAHADGGGNFSTGSMSIPTTPGSYTYTFKGATSNMSASSVVVVH